MTPAFRALYRRAVDRDRLASPIARALFQGFQTPPTVRDAFNASRTVLAHRKSFGERLVDVCGLADRTVRLFPEPLDPEQLLYKIACRKSFHTEDQSKLPGEYPEEGSGAG